MDDDGKVIVDDAERTSAANIYAIGDVAKVCMYEKNAHVHAHEPEKNLFLFSVHCIMHK